MDVSGNNISQDESALRNGHHKGSVTAEGDRSNNHRNASEPDVVQPPVTMTYTPSVVRRAQRAVLCSPFYHRLLAEMRVSSVSVPTIAENSGALKGYTQQPLSEVATESELMWLASVGILRREVDGQGLTDSFRLTPLGRRIVELWQSQGCPDRRANLLDYVKNAVVRWCRIPDWLA